MAETAVGNVISKITPLIPLLKDEVILLRGVHSQVQEIKNNLELILAFLKDVDAKAEMANASNSVKEWVKQLREVAYRLEDVIDLYLLKVAKRHHTPDDDLDNLGSKISFYLVHLCSNICSFIGSIIPRHQIATEIGEIRGSITRLYEGRNNLGINLYASETSSAAISTRQHDLRMGALFIKDDQLVGVEETKELLTRWILNGEPKRTVIAVVGEGGLGKTAIVKKLYNEQKEQRSFKCYAWITVSRSHKDEHLLKTIMQKLYEEDNNKIAAKEIGETMMSKEDLTRRIREYLQGRNYMIVFDDVREEDFWKGVQYALPIEGNARIMITTRDKGVAECIPFARVYIHELQPLPSQDGLELFLMKAFQFDSEGWPEELMELSGAFVDKCEGVPLAIEAIAGLLSTKMKTVSEWQKVYDRLYSKLSNDPHLKSYYQVLSESYHDLPYHLKSCLLYFGLFPEGYSIGRMRLIRLWVAEGFAKEDENNDQTQEEAAEEYLGELIRRCLVKVSVLYYYGGVKSCRVHDLMHAFITKKCEELNFCQLLKDREFRFSRRLSIHTAIGRAGGERSRSNYGQVRSFFACDVKDLPKPVVESLLSSFKLLVALDFENSGLDYLPEPVGLLLNLKYLSLQGTKIKLIPKFIGNLQNLETLNLKGTQVGELPKEINKLLKLRHLLAYPSEAYFLRGNQPGVKLNEGIGCLTALQSLIMVDAADQDGLIEADQDGLIEADQDGLIEADQDGLIEADQDGLIEADQDGLIEADQDGLIEADQDGLIEADQDGVVEELKNLKKIRRLGIKIRKMSGNQLCSSIKNMTHLRSLAIYAADLEGHGDLELQSLIDPPPNIQRLYLDGRLENLPEWICKLKHLVRLRLKWTALTQDPLPILKCLTELVELILYQSYDGVELHFQEGGFTKLKHLTLESFLGLRTIKIDEKALPRLEALILGPCPQMVQVPTDIQNLESLEKVFLREMPSEFADSMYLLLKGNIWLYVQSLNEIIQG